MDRHPNADPLFLVRSSRSRLDAAYPRRLLNAIPTTHYHACDNHDKQAHQRKIVHFAIGVGRALRSTVKEAQKIARMYNTPLYYWENGKVAAQKPWL